MWWLAVSINGPVCFVTIATVIIHTRTFRFAGENPRIEIDASFSRWGWRLEIRPAGWQDIQRIILDQAKKEQLLGHVRDAIRALPKKERADFRDELVQVPRGGSYLDMEHEITPLLRELDRRLRFHRLRRPREIRQIASGYSF
jgi:hypothetical protein